jgi:type I restriction enzyme S subunit
MVAVDPESLPLGTPGNFSFYYVDIASAADGRLQLPSAEIEYRDAPSRARRMIRDGDVLMSTVRPNLKAFSYCKLPHGRFVASTGFAVLRALNGNDRRYILYAILSDSVTQQINSYAVGSNYPAINSSDVKRLQVPAFDPPHQRRIAEILSALDETIEQTEALTAKHQQIKAGLIHDLFTRGVTSNGQLRPTRSEAPQLYKESPLGWIPREWNVEQLEAMTAAGAPICYGIVQPGEYCENGISVVAIYNLNSDLETAERCSPLIEKAYVRSRIQGGDVLISVKGSIGRVDVTRLGFSGNISRDIARIRPRPGLDAQYLRYRMESNQVQAALQSIAVGTTRQELSIGRLKKIAVANPEPPEQGMIAERLISCDNYLRNTDRNLQKLRNQKQGLMHDLLTGRVRVKVAESTAV